jgi:SAM-dependent methyltransferase
MGLRARFTTRRTNTSRVQSRRPENLGHDEDPDGSRVVNLRADAGGSPGPTAAIPAPLRNPHSSDRNTHSGQQLAAELRFPTGVQSAMPVTLGTHPLDEARDLAETVTIVAAAWDAGVFEALREPRTPEAVAERAGLDPRGAGIILPVLVELGLVEESADGFRLAPDARPLAERGPQTAGGGLPLWLHNLRGLTRLPEVLRSGRPLDPETDRAAEEDERDSIARFMAGMAASPQARVRRVVDECLARAPGARRALDLGGGPGLYARAFAEKGLEVTLLDTPATVDFVRDEYGLGDVRRLRLVGADFIEDPLPEGPFDIALLSNILHIYAPEENIALLHKVAGVTAPGGVAAIAEFVRGRSPRAARFAMIMLMRTEGGNSYTERELAGWLEASGFADPRMVDVDDDRQLVTGVRARGR